MKQKQSLRWSWISGLVLLQLLAACKSDDAGGGGSAGDDGSAGNKGAAGEHAHAGNHAGAGNGESGAGAGGSAGRNGGHAGTKAGGTSGSDGNGNDNGEQDAGPDSGGSNQEQDAGPDSGEPDTGVPDAGGDDPNPQPTLNGCTAFVDRTGVGEDRTLAWSYSIETDAERCIEIKVGQSVNFDGDLVDHPLAADGGKSPSPIDGNTNVYTFFVAGAYGFICTAHEEMNGVVWVVE